MKTALLLSGGMDSIAIAWWRRPELAITVDYGQRPALAELRAAASAAEAMGIEHLTVKADLSALGSGDMAGAEPLSLAPVTEWWPFRNQMLVTLAAIDDLWSDYLEAVRELKSGTIWTSLGGRNPHHVYLTEVHAMFSELERAIPEEAAARLARGDADSLAALGRGATWTYLTTDEPFGSMTERLLKGPLGLGLLLTTNM